MNKLILVKNDGRMTAKKENKIKNEDLEDVTYILVESKKLGVHFLVYAPEIIEFKKVEITFRISIIDAAVIEYGAYDDATYSEEIKVEAYGYTSLCESMFMLCHISSVNAILNGMDTTSNQYILALIPYMKLRAFNEQNKVIYDKEYLETDPMEYMYREYSYFTKFKKIYHPVLQYENIKIKKDNFYLTNDKLSHDTVGLNLNSVNSFLIVQKDYAKVFNKIGPVYYDLIIYTTNEERHEEIKNKTINQIEKFENLEDFDSDFIHEYRDVEVFEDILPTILGFGTDESINNFFGLIKFYRITLAYIRYIFNNHVFASSFMPLHVLFLLELDPRHKHGFNKIYYIFDDEIENSNLFET